MIRQAGILKIEYPDRPPYPSYRAIDRFADNLVALRRDFSRLKLLTNVQKSLPFTILDEKRSLLAVEILLSRQPEAVTDTFVRTMTDMVATRLAKVPVPIERRSMEFVAQTRAAAGSRVVSFLANTPGLDRH